MMAADHETTADETVTAQKIAVVLREDLEAWKRLNVVAFTASGVAAQADSTGQPYRDLSGNEYLPMFKDPVLVFGASDQELKRTAERARSRGVTFSLFTQDLFSTFNDVDNREAVARIPTEDLPLVGLAFRCERKTADKILKGLRLLR